MTYHISPDLKEVVQQSTMKEPHVKDYMFMINGMFGQVPDIAPAYFDEIKAYEEHLKSLPRFPARGFTEKWLGVDLKEGEHFEFANYLKVDGPLVAVAIPATEETIQQKAQAYAREHGKIAEVKGYPVFAFMELEAAFIAGASSQKQEIERLKEIIKTQFHLRRQRVDVTGFSVYEAWSKFEQENNL